MEKKDLQTLNLTAFRRKKQKEYLKKYEGAVQRVIRSYFYKSIDASTAQNLSDYLNRRSALDHQGIDPEVFRNELHDYVFQHFGPDVFAELQKQAWFDGRWINMDFVVEKLLSFVILGEEAFVVTKK